MSTVPTDPTPVTPVTPIVPAVDNRSTLARIFTHLGTTVVMVGSGLSHLAGPVALALVLFTLGGQKGCSLPWVQPKPDGPVTPVSFEFDNYRVDVPGYGTSITAITRGSSVKWKIIDGPETDDRLLWLPPGADSHTVRFSGPRPGVYTLQAATSLNNEVETGYVLVTNGVGPIPPVPTPPGPTPPGPGPTPPGPTPPSPPSPTPGQGLRVLIIEESQDRQKLPKEQLAIFTNTAIRQYMASHGAKPTAEDKSPALLILDQNADVSKYPAAYQELFRKPRGSLPYVYIGNGKTGTEGPLPKNPEEALKLLQQFGGS